MKKLIKYISIILLSLFVSGMLLLFFLPTPKLLDGVSFSKAVYDEQQHLLRLTLTKDEKYRLYTPLSGISKELVEGTLLQEDQYFRYHYGVNPIALSKALWQTYVAKSRRIGASTITMQLARIRYDIHSKALSGKIVQMLRAIQIEMHYSKDQILEAYLNLAPYGGNIEGVGAASLIYFDKSVQKLTLPEALTLSIIPQNPGKRTPNNKELHHIRDLLFKRWVAQHPNDKEKEELFRLPLVMKTNHHLPFKAPHFVNMVLNDEANHQQSVETTLDSRIQTIVERITSHFLTRKKGLGVSNAVVMVVDVRDMSVKGMMGSASFFDRTIGGQINGVETKRSPGSTLKPFIYGLALDQGLIHPNTVLKDVPHSFNGYNPENFDYDFMGPIKAKDALVLSRNIPAIFLASQLTQPTLHQFLERAQVSRLRSESYYGLSLTLGGAELTMRELIGLYAMLANDGIWRPIRFYKDEPHPSGQRLLSQESSFLVLDMLKATPHNNQGQYSQAVPVAWKTGTSSGFHDAWTIGVFGPYVMGVWIGNFDNTPNPAFVGKSIAAPLFFELADAIQHELSPLPQMAKDPGHMNLKIIKVCKASGMLPTRYCTDTEKTWFIPGKSPITTDTIYREVAINGLTGQRTCHIDENTRFEIFEFWPSDVLTIFKRAGIQRKTPPFFEADCNLSGDKGLSPQITSPQTGIDYVLRANTKQNNAIPLTAVTDAGIEYIYWFVNEHFIAKTKSNEPYLWVAKPGHYVIRVVDEHGLSDARDLKIVMEN